MKKLLAILTGILATLGLSTAAMADIATEPEISEAAEKGMSWLVPALIALAAVVVIVLVIARKRRK